MAATSASILQVTIIRFNTLKQGCGSGPGVLVGSGSIIKKWVDPDLGFQNLIRIRSDYQNLTSLEIQTFLFLTNVLTLYIYIYIYIYIFISKEESKR